MWGLNDPDCPVDMDKLKASIKRHEGCRLVPYRDTQGFLTVGYGRNLSSKGISQNEAEYLLQSDLAEALSIAEGQKWWANVKDNDARARAFVEIIFNLGLGTLAYFRKALAAALQNDWDACSNELLDSLWAKQVGKRAEELALMIKTGQD